MYYEALENIPNELKPYITYPYLTPTGYVRVFDKRQNRKRKLHDVIYEYYKGTIPKGYQIHHKDFNKLNNDIDNLVMLTPKEHRDIHAKAKWVCKDGAWYKPCKHCGELKPLTEFYKIDKGTRYYHNCKHCASMLSTKYSYEHYTQAQRNEQARINWHKRKARRLANGL